MSSEDQKKDIILIKKTIKGNQDAEKELYVKYKKIINDYLLKKYSNYYDIEDDVSEILIKVFLNLDSYDKKWLLTGDIGFMDEHGWVEIRDRKKSLIKVSGHSVFPKEVEELLGHHEMVDEVAVAGLPDEMTGEAVKAWVTLKKGFKADRDINSEQLKEWARENMAKWKSPKYIEFARKLPVSATGKVQRRELQEKDLTKLEQGKSIKG